MSKGPFVIFGVFAAICVIVIPYFALAKEGGEDAGPVKVESWDEDGKELFVNNCGPCHTLAAAGTDGVVGPSLDDLLAPGGNATFEGSYVRALHAVTCGFGHGPDARRDPPGRERPGRRGVRGRVRRPGRRGRRAVG